MTRRIYAYTVIGKDAEPWRRKIGRALVEGAGLIKVGETTKSTARARIKQQLGTAYPDLEGVNILLDEPATREDGSQFGRPAERRVGKECVGLCRSRWSR